MKRIVSLLTLLVLTIASPVFADAEEDYHKFTSAMQNDDYWAAVGYCKTSADSGYAPAQIALAEMYYQGLLLPKSDQLAFEWMLEAAQQGNPAAQYRVGAFLAVGIGTPIDYEASFDWYTKSADQGNNDGQYGAGVYLLTGRGTEQNHEAGLALLEKAAAQNNIGALNTLGYLYNHGHYVEKSVASALKYFEAAAELGDLNAQLDAANIYAKGPDELRSLARSRDMYALAAQHDDPFGLMALGTMMLMGSGGPQLFEEGYELVNKSARLGFVPAQKVMVFVYLGDYGIPKNEKQALLWFAVATLNGATAFPTFDAASNAENFNLASIAARECIESGYQKCEWE